MIDSVEELRAAVLSQNKENNLRELYRAYYELEAKELLVHADYRFSFIATNPKISVAILEDNICIIGDIDNKYPILYGMPLSTGSKKSFYAIGLFVKLGLKILELNFESYSVLPPIKIQR